jgi:hypothetical protein
MTIEIEKIKGKDYYKNIRDKDYYKKIHVNDRTLIKEICENIDEMYLLTFPYGAIVWQHDKFLYRDAEYDHKPMFTGSPPTIVNQFAEFSKNCPYPVGLVLKGAFEVFRYQHPVGSTDPDSKRKSADTLLTPGNIFGLFEAFANLHGSWIISAGLQSFFLSNSIGNFKNLGSLAKSMQHTTRSEYNFSRLLRNVDIKDWNAQCLIFDIKDIKKAEIINKF